MLALSGLETMLKGASKYRQNKDKINMVSYADDFIVTASSKEILEKIVMPQLVKSLSAVGLELSEAKTKITHIDDGFDFLVFNVRKYNGKLLIKPSKAGIKRFLTTMKEVIKRGVTLPTENLIYTLNNRLIGWVNYYRSVVSSDVFYRIDHEILKTLLRWAYKRHARKGKKWIVKKYFISIEGNHWRFYCKTKSKDNKEKLLFLKHAGDTKIRRHIKIKSDATPFDPLYKDYFEQREQRRLHRNTFSKPKCSVGVKIIQSY